MADPLAAMMAQFYGEGTKEGAVACPLPTQDVDTNTRNRDEAIRTPVVQYGPADVARPGDFYARLAEHWKTSEDAVSGMQCGNCAAFDLSPRMEQCMPGPLQDQDGKLGYCWMHEFKCHSARTCRTWAKGGPIRGDDVSAEWQARG